MAKRIYISNTRYLLTGGPLHGKLVNLSCPGTLSFTLNGMTGHYNQQNQWVPKDA